MACIAGDTNHTDSFRRNTATFSQFAQDAVYPYGSGGPNASFALLTAYYMRTHGATREDFGKLCVAQRNNALKNPLALFKKPLTLGRVSQCAADRRSAAAVRLRHAVRRSGGFSGDAAQDRRELWVCATRGFWARSNGTMPSPTTPFRIAAAGPWTRDELYAQAGLGPDAIDFLQCYDDYPVINALQFEGLGFCGEGAAPDFIRANTFEAEGTFPFNTSGGQLSVGQAGAAGGHLGIVEAIRQLTAKRRAPASPMRGMALSPGSG